MAQVTINDLAGKIPAIPAAIFKKEKKEKALTKKQKEKKIADLEALMEKGELELEELEKKTPKPDDLISTKNEELDIIEAQLTKLQE